jgi:hypothetical protein
MNASNDECRKKQKNLISGDGIGIVYMAGEMPLTHLMKDKGAFLEMMGKRAHGQDGDCKKQDLDNGYNTHKIYNLVRMRPSIVMITDCS